MTNLNLKECLKEICNIIGETNSGYTGSQIDNMMISIDRQYDYKKNKGQNFNNGVCYIIGKKKAERIYDFAFFLVNKHGEINTIKKLCEYYLNPIKWLQEQEKQNLKFIEINKILNLTGFEITNEMKLININKINTIKEVEAKWNSFYSELKEYNEKGLINNEILKYCDEEAKKEFYYHVIDQISKHLEEKIKKKISCIDDVETAWNLLQKKVWILDDKQPYFITNKIITKEKIDITALNNYQNGYVLFIKGLLKYSRNLFSHTSRKKMNDVSKEETVSVLTSLSRAYDFIDSLSRIKE